MANFNKSFNFRNGVQVDDDNFVVNPNGQVGIGSTIPTEFFDLRGNATISGLTTTQNLFAGIGTVGVLTATHAGITTLAVDAIEIDGLTLRTIVGYHTLGWNIDYAYGTEQNPGLYGSGSGISTSLKVGIGTTQAIGRYQLLIGQDPQVGMNTEDKYQYGVGINYGNIHAAGIVTSSEYFVGVGSLITQINAGNIEYGIISDDRLPDTITSNIIGILTGNVTGTASTALSLNGLPTIEVTAIDAPNAYINSGIVTNLTSTDATIGILTTNTILHSAGSIGIGSALPSVDLDIHKESPVVHVQSSSGESNIKVVADDDRANIDVISFENEARIRFAHTLDPVGIASSSAMIRFGSDTGSLEIINNDTGDVKFVIDNTPAGINTGSFSWKHGSTLSADEMTLTYDGKLGIQEENPTERLHVGGGATVDGGTLYVSDAIEVRTGNITVHNGIFEGDAQGLTNLQIPNPLNTAIDQGSTDGVVSVSTFTQLHVFNTNPNVLSKIGVSSIGIGTDYTEFGVDATFEFGMFRGIGINTYNPLPRGIGAPLPDDGLFKPYYLLSGDADFGVTGKSVFDQVAIGTVVSLTPIAIHDRSVTLSGFGTSYSRIYGHNSYISLGIRPDLSDIYGGYSTPEYPEGTFETDSGVLFIGCKSSIVHGGLTQDYLDAEVGRSIFDYGNVGIATTLAPMIIPTVTTSQRGTIKNFQDSGDPVEGSIIFNTTTKKFQGYNGTTWVDFH